MLGIAIVFEERPSFRFPGAFARKKEIKTVMGDSPQQRSDDLTVLFEDTAALVGLLVALDWHFSG